MTAHSKEHTGPQAVAAKSVPAREPGFLSWVAGPWAGVRNKARPVRLTGWVRHTEHHHERTRRVKQGKNWAQNPRKNAVDRNAVTWTPWVLALLLQLVLPAGWGSRGISASSPQPPRPARAEASKLTTCKDVWWAEHSQCCSAMRVHHHGMANAILHEYLQYASNKPPWETTKVTLPASAVGTF